MVFAYGGPESLAFLREDVAGGVRQIVRVLILVGLVVFAAYIAGTLAMLSILKPADASRLAGLPDAYTIGFAGSDDLTAGSPTHQMKGVTTGNTNVVQYQLTDATPSAGNTAPLSASSSVISGTGTGVAVAKTLQAKVINYTTPDAPDTYTDTVTMSVAY